LASPARKLRSRHQIFVNSPEGPLVLGCAPGSEGTSSDGLPRELDGDLLGELDGGLTGELALRRSGDLVRDLVGDAEIGRIGDLGGDITGALLGILRGDLAGDLTGGSLGAFAGDRKGDLTGDLDRRGLVGGISRGNSSGPTWGPACGPSRASSLAGGITDAPACLLHVQLRACSSATFWRCLNSTSVRIRPSCSASVFLILSVKAFSSVCSCCLWSSLVFSSSFEKAPFFDFSSLIVSRSWRASPSI
jgi:hypothetical protein